MIRQLQRLQPANGGLTLVECLIAILVVNLSVAMLAAPLLLVAATRLRNDRINQATEIARGELDRLRVMMEQGIDIREDSGLLPPASTVGASVSNPSVLSRQAPPTSLESCSLPNNATMACERQLNNARFGVQIYRGTLITDAARRVLAYPVQVRVYSAAALPMEPESNPDPIEPEAVMMTSSIVGAERRPLAVLTTVLLRSDSAETLPLMAVPEGDGGSGSGS
ncbi:MULTISPECIES: hypothetical protein [unclassified Thermosynechococcus]|uniref:hypothetical protein n=1 Tax=unclassified Thermosynechococcus TaxID=2622553 RepID=UPI002872E316|nr:MULTISPECIES: hypothetical protein [unclassified Thermosynechococcus]WNC31492.1 hypothetical protein RHH81_07515 [Thermosynechococcus sp. PKX95]WNC34016.1 hypothetical protein RHH79_07510 [Thermosynechococcus sp. PKX91]WNC36540.1 hypothetical protein RHI11_07515 [Thermosynechococcus sp. WL11]WNC39061.1 hypothetical protein RHI18_07515 [Thermosynechococcus sp. WL17]WNC41583.1 hypothetical protein RHI14_07510 [Thermosynechococcus sp. WL15]